MISFRYHLVSLIAVFLALALGIVVGTTALNGPITTDLRHQVNSLKGDRTDLAQQVKTLNNQLADANSFASVYGQKLIANTLNDQPVLVIGMPNVSSSVQDKVTSNLTAAGAKITGQLEITNDYIDQRRGSDIVALATSTHPVGLTLPNTSDPGQLGGALLAFVLLGQGQSTDLTSVVQGFTSLHMLSVTGNSVKPAKNVVVVGTGGLEKGSYAQSTELDLVNALQSAGGHVVVVGNHASAAETGLVASVLGEGGPSTTVSTVDNADTAIGQVTAVLATIDIINSQVGHYGTGPGADALFPTITK